MSYLKLHELWSECEKMEKPVLTAFLEGLMEMLEKKIASKHNKEPIGDKPMKPCVAQKKRAVCNRGRWEPQEDDLLHQCVSSSFNPHQGFFAFASDPRNSKRRSEDAAQQRYYTLISGGRW